jgi:hypothetical protein
MKKQIHKKMKKKEKSKSKSSSSGKDKGSDSSSSDSHKSHKKKSHHKRRGCHHHHKPACHEKVQVDQHGALENLESEEDEHASVLDQMCRQFCRPLKGAPKYVDKRCPKSCMKKFHYKKRPKGAGSVKNEVKKMMNKFHFGSIGNAMKAKLK